MSPSFARIGMWISWLGSVEDILNGQFGERDVVFRLPCFQPPVDFTPSLFDCTGIQFSFG
jgi:hypothetical protein